MADARLPYKIGQNPDGYLDAETARTDGDGKAVLRQRVTSRLVDEDGASYGPDNRLAVDIAGMNIESLTVSFDSKVSTGNTTDVPLLAGETFVGAWEEVVDYASITAAITTDVDSAFNGATVQFATEPDDAHIITMEAATITGGYPAYFTFSPQAKYFRIYYTNGAAPQTRLLAQVIMSFQPITPQGPLAGQSDDLSPSLSTQSHLKARVASGPYAGLWLPINMDPATGRLLVSQDPDESGLTDEQLRAAPVPVDTGLTIPTDGLTDVELRAAPVGVSVTNLPDSDSDFKRVAKAEPKAGEELRFDDIAGGDLYIGAAPDGAATGDAAWKVVRYYRTTTGAITRTRYRTGVAWDDRTAGWS